MTRKEMLTEMRKQLTYTEFSSVQERLWITRLFKLIEELNDELETLRYELTSTEQE